jgi:hypothetical protein
MEDAGLEVNGSEIVAWDCGRTSIVEMDMAFASHRLWRDDASEMKNFLDYCTYCAVLILPLWPQSDSPISLI